MTTSTPSTTPRIALPWPGLLALCTAVFITSLTETLPAGVLPEMSRTLSVTSSAAGQAVTVYAAGTALTVIPLASATATVPRKPLLLAAMGVFLIANTLTAVAPTYPVVLGGRLLAGVAAGLAWAILAGYARLIAPPGLEGRAIAIAMTGIPLALSLGLPAGTLIGQQVGWRTAFATISALTVAVIAWIWLTVPSVGQSPTARAGHPTKVTAREAMAVPGVAVIMAVVAVFVLAHTVIYAYIAPYLQHVDLNSAIDAILLAFGVACLVSIWFVGRHIDRHLRRLALSSAALFTMATVAFATTPPQPVVWAATIAWGLGWGGAPTLLQTAASHAGMQRSPAAADAAQAILVTLWNGAMALGGIIGGALLQGFGIASVATAAAALGAVSFASVAAARRHAFPLLREAARHG